MVLEIDLTEQEEKALKFICRDSVGVRIGEFLNHMEVDQEEANNIILSLRRKGFKIEGLPFLKLSTSYVHYDSLIKG